MKVYKRKNVIGDWRCPICGTGDEGAVVVIKVVDTKNCNNDMGSRQFHLNCLDMSYDEKGKIIYQKIKEVV